MKQNEIKELSSRIVNFDFLRGFFVLLALDQHFTYYINMWYVEYFRDAIALTSTYKIHLPMIGTQVPSDTLNYFLALIFTPWVSQIYLTMAAFNLAKRPQQEFAESMPLKLKTLGLVLLFFIAENFIVAPNFGQAISVYPIMLWMLVLGILSLIYKHAGIGGVIGLTIFSTLRFVIPIEALSGFFQEYMAHNFHPGFEYDARLEYFILSGCLGFIMGYVHHQRPSLAFKKDLYFSLAGMAFILVYVLWGDEFIVYRDDLFRTEHDLARTFTGTSYILGMQAVVLSFFLKMEKSGIKLKVPVISWIGKNSLLVFGLHRILFVRIIAPISIFFGSIYSYTIGKLPGEALIYVGITLLLCYFIKKSRITDTILQQKG